MKLIKLKKLIILISIVSLLINPCYAQLVNDYMLPVNNIKMSGHIAEKLNLAYNNRIMAQDVDHLVKPFKNRTETRLWQSEFWGKWFTSAVLAYKYRPEQRLKLKLDKAINDLIKTQSSDGYIGNYADSSHLKGWDIWGRKYTMLGLLDYYEITKEKNYLDAAEKLADHLIQEIRQSPDKLIVTKGFYRGMAASSVLEPIMKLYRISGDTKYLAFAKEMVQQWETPQGPQLISKSKVNVSERFPQPQQWYSAEQGQKAYEMMSCYEGLLELYRATGEKKYLDAVQNTWENIKKTEINIAGSGASEEMWFGGREKQTMPIAHYQETCVTVTWIKLNQQLLRLTGDARYADEIERSYYNALLAALNYDGSDWAKYTPLNGLRLPGEGQCGMNINCCNASGARGLYTLPSTVIMKTKDGVSVNFYVPGTYIFQTPKGQSATLSIQTDYPISGSIHIKLKMNEDEKMNIRIRIPAWSLQNNLEVNGKPVSNMEKGKFIDLNNKWSKESDIKLKLDLRGRLVKQDEGHRYFIAVCRGPIVLAEDSRLANMPLISVNQPLADKSGYIQLKAINTGDRQNNLWMQFEAPFLPESYKESKPDPVKILLCDYASAGNGQTASHFKVWLPQLYSGRAERAGILSEGGTIY